MKERVIYSKLIKPNTGLNSTFSCCCTH